MRLALESLIHELRLDGRVHLPGQTPHAWEALKAGSIFAMTSRVEGFPNALMEAMAVGLPAVVYDCPSGPREMTGGGRYARLVEMGSEDAFVSELRQLMADPSQRAHLGQTAARVMRDSYGLPAVLALWQTVFSRVVRRHD